MRRKFETLQRQVRYLSQPLEIRMVVIISTLELAKILDGCGTQFPEGQTVENIQRLLDSALKDYEMTLAERLCLEGM
jgi:hypothetical protein